MKLKAVKNLASQTFAAWSADKAPKKSAALAYYTIFSLAPLLVIVIAIAGLVFGADAAQGQLVSQIRGFVGEQGASAIQTMIHDASQHGGGVVATIVGVITLLLGAAGVFSELQDSLNSIWQVQAKRGKGVWGVVKDRFLSFGMVVGIGFLLLVSLVVSAALSAATKYFSLLLPGADIIWHAVNIVVSLGMTSLLFAMIFKFLPDAKITWRDVSVGSVLTAVLFTIGQNLIGLYLGRSAAVSVYGAAGSLAILLLWVYYTAQILFLGAEFTKVWSSQRGKRIVPAGNAGHEQRTRSHGSHKHWRGTRHSPSHA